MKRFTFIFLILNILLSSFYLDIWHNDNTTSRVLTVLSIVDFGTLKIDSFANKTIDKSIINGHYYSEKPPLPSLLIVPFYAFEKSIGLFVQPTDFTNYSKPVYILGSFICGSLPFVLICIIFFTYASRHTNKYRAAILTMIFLYSSFIFIYSGTFFAHVLSSCFLLLSYTFIKFRKKYFYSGLFLGLAILSDYSVAFIAFLWMLQIFINELKFKNVLYFGVGLSPTIISIIVYNIMTTGSPVDLLYNHIAGDGFQNASNLGFSYPRISALYGLTISSYRGLLIYCPFLLFSLITFFKEKQEITIKWSKNYLFLVTIVYILLISSHMIWWGGWSYGPRQLMPIAVLLLFESIIFISKIEINKYRFWIFSIIAVFVTWIVKSTVVYSAPSEIKNPFANYFFQNLLNKDANPNNLLTMLFDVEPWTAALIWLMLFVVVINYFSFKQRSKSNVIESKL